MWFLKSTYKKAPISFWHPDIWLPLPLMISGLNEDAFEGKTLKATSSVLIALRAIMNGHPNQWMILLFPHDDNLPSPSLYTANTDKASFSSFFCSSVNDTGTSWRHWSNALDRISCNSSSLNRCSTNTRHRERRAELTLKLDPLLSVKGRIGIQERTLPWIFCCSTNQMDCSLFNIGKKQILLCLCESVDLINKNNGLLSSEW